MSFFRIVLRGLLRRPVRTALTMLGIAIGIGAVVMLVGLSWGFEKSWSEGFNAHQTDIVVGNLSGGVMPKSFNEDVEEMVAALPHVADTTTLFAELMGVEDLSMIMVSGRETDGFAWKSLELVDGRMPENDAEYAVVLGTLAAESLKKKVGDSLRMKTASTHTGMRRRSKEFSIALITTDSSTENETSLSPESPSENVERIVRRRIPRTEASYQRSAPNSSTICFTPSGFTLRVTLQETCAISFPARTSKSSEKTSGRTLILTTCWRRNDPPKLPGPSNIPTCPPRPKNRGSSYT